MEIQRKGAAVANTLMNAGAKIINNGGNSKDLTEVLVYFQKREGTSLDCALGTGILRNSITYYIDSLLKMGLLQVVRIAPDFNTRHKAQWYSADPSKWQKPKHLQLSLFDEKEV